MTDSNIVILEDDTVYVVVSPDDVVAVEDSTPVPIATIMVEGPQGSAGATGAVGPTGPAGEPGATGAIGPAGEPGANGATGAVGPRGDTGAQGIQGIQGIQGEQGLQGIPGIQGEKGDKGDAGVSLDIQGYVATADDLPPNPADGDAYVTTSNGLLNFFDGSTWTGVPFVGPQGATGAQGIQGIQGERGDTGSQGIQGIQGIAGAAGPPGPTGPTGPAGTTTWAGITDKPTTFVYKYAETIGNNSATSIPVTHNLGTRDVTVLIYDAATYERVNCDIFMTDTNTVTFVFAVAPASNAYRVVVVG